MKYFRQTLCFGLLVAVIMLSRNHSAAAEPLALLPTGKESVLLKPETIQGCYELGVLKWQPDLKLGEDAIFITPPSRIQLLAEHGTKGFENRGYLVRPAPGTSPSIHRNSYWNPTGAKTLEIAWTTRFSGLTMKLSVEGETLKGKAESFWDFPRPRQTAHISAPKVDCDGKQ